MTPERFQAAIQEVEQAHEDCMDILQDSDFHIFMVNRGYDDSESPADVIKMIQEYKDYLMLKSKPLLH